MTRKRRGTGRGTNMGKGPLSGSSIVTNPSGTTINQYGTTTPQIGDGTSTLDGTDLLNLSSINGPAVGSTSPTGLLISGNVINWAGASIEINTGLSTIMAFTAVFTPKTGVDDLTTVSNVNVPVYVPSSTAGIVTAALYSQGNNGALGLLGAGGSIAWMALGV